MTITVRTCGLSADDRLGNAERWPIIALGIGSVLQDIVDSSSRNTLGGARRTGPRTMPEQRPYRYLAIVAAAVGKGLHPADDPSSLWDRDELRRAIEMLDQATKATAAAEPGVASARD